MANKTPIGARDGLKAAATTDAEATPPTLACEPTAVKKKGAFTKYDATIVKTACIRIQIKPTKNNIVT